MASIFVVLKNHAVAGEGDIVKVGEEAPAFSGVISDGSAVAIESFKGKVVLLTFFTTWCPTCKILMPLIQKRVSAVLKAPDLVIVAVGREHSARELKAFQQARGYDLIFVADPDQAICKRYASKYIPRCYVIGRDGLVKFTSLGFKENEFSEMVSMLQSEK